MILFKLVKLEDKSVLQPVLSQIPYPLCNFTFTNMIIWNSFYSPAYSFVDGMLVIVSQIDTHTYFNFPLGNGNTKTVIDKLIDYAQLQKTLFSMINITEEMKTMLEKDYPDRFAFSVSSDYSDYLYNTQDLILLQGKKYQSKRNHINKFKSAYNYRYHAMTDNDIAECLEMHRQWAEVHCLHGNSTLASETCATRKALQLFGRLGLKGGVLRVDEKVIAFTLGQPINHTTFDICIEKALSEYEGSYPMINQLFLKDQASDYAYINREEDLGVEGLRKAKLSYYPVRLLSKYNAVLQ
ncbi:MAG: phosphatidylglycerol lysyltransferase domain-containing protein [Bacteroidales bacterium]|jgi:hypothetical protein|nr:phosphatidylglycerol lysyltransferase domain-containing protein [Bacteroidales bacterium]